MSLDLLRGITIAAMILVNNPGDEAASYWPLRHAMWNGWTPTDLIFPFFLFMVGVSMVFSFSSRLKRGESRGHLMRHVLWRGLVLFGLGLFINGFPNRFDPSLLRIYGVLQRIGVCYVISAIVVLWSGWRGRVAAIVGCLLGYWLIMRFIPVPGAGVPGRDMPFLEPDCNLAAWLDRKLLLGHLYDHTRDPEGVLSTIPAIATPLLGVLTGEWLRSQRSARAKAMGLLVFGVVGLAAGELWNLWFPINKNLWTSSFVLFTAGFALVCLALCYWILDIKQWRGWAKPGLVFGMNAIAAYFFAEIVAHLVDRVKVQTAMGKVSLQEFVYNRWFEPLARPANASLIYALVFVLICWMAMWGLYQRKVFFKI